MLHVSNRMLFISYNYILHFSFNYINPLKDEAQTALFKDPVRTAL